MIEIQSGVEIRTLENGTNSITELFLQSVFECSEFECSVWSIKFRLYSYGPEHSKSELFKMADSLDHIDYKFFINPDSAGAQGLIKS